MHDNTVTTKDMHIQYKQIIYKVRRPRKGCSLRRKGRSVPVSVLADGESRVILRLLVMSQYQRVTDRRTDRKADARRLSLSL